MSHHDLAAAMCARCSDRGIVRIGTWEDPDRGWLCDGCADEFYDPISGTEYTVGECENCLARSTKLLATNVESGGCTDRIPLCERCRNPWPFS